MLEVTDLSKRYGKTTALSALSLRAEPGQVLGVAGPNGAGKSTLVKILAGETKASGGQVCLDDVIRSDADLARLTAVVHQEPQLFPTLTVAENLLVGRERSGVRRPSLSIADQQLLHDLEILDHAHEFVGGLPIAVQQRTEIARALALDARIFLFDEPNSALTEPESQELFEQVRALARQQRIVIFVSHRLQELATIADAVAVLKDGRTTALIVGAALTESALAHELAASSATATAAAGVDGSSPVPRQAASERDDSRALTLSDWRDRAGGFAVGGLEIGRGEVVAVLGVEGSGAREFTLSIAGFHATARSSTMRWLGAPTEPDRSSGFVPASRQDSVFSKLSVVECLVARVRPGRIASASGLLNRRWSYALGERLIREFNIRCSGPTQTVSELSGGNQQKVVIASAIACEPDILVVEEPTRGVDIQSRTEIYRLLRRFADGGRSVVLYCTEVTEAFEAADTCLVFSRGCIVGRVAVATVDGVTGLVDAVAGMEGGASLPLRDAKHPACRVKPSSSHR